MVLTIKKCTINPKNMDNKCFQYSATHSMYHKQIGKNLDRISNIKPFINNINWDNIIFPPKQQDYQQFDMNNKSIALNTLQVDEQQKISHLFNSKHNKARKDKVILLILENKHHVAVKNLNSLLKDKND